MGGLVGQNDDGHIAASSATGTVTGDESVGGLIGENNDGHIAASSATGTVTGEEDARVLAASSGTTTTAKTGVLRHR
ncbi:hypothetical protein D8S78_24275 [Natrialba swarupiae]|nr:hypothetical protein [Natrialba swarupiae]